MTKLEELCAASKTATLGVRNALYHSLGAPRLLDALWRLQDQLHRLIEHLEDHPGEQLNIQIYCVGLTRSVMGILRITASDCSYTLPAVREACARINEYAIELEYMKEWGQARGTSSGQ